MSISFALMFSKKVVIPVLAESRQLVVFDGIEVLFCDLAINVEIPSRRRKIGESILFFSRHLLSELIVRIAWIALSIGESTPIPGLCPHGGRFSPC